MEGSSVSACVGSGTWSNPPPKCTAACTYPGSSNGKHIHIYCVCCEYSTLQLKNNAAFGHIWQWPNGQLSLQFTGSFFFSPLIEGEASFWGKVREKNSAKTWFYAILSRELPQTDQVLLQSGRDCRILLQSWTHTPWSPDDQVSRWVSSRSQDDQVSRWVSSISEDDNISR